MPDEVTGEGGGPRAAVLGGRYRVTAPLGRGGMADVHVALDTLLRREVAVKVFRAGPGDQQLREWFRSEIQLAASLDHRQLVRIFDAGVEDDQPWCVMQLVPGGTLEAAPKPLPEGRVRQVGADIASALAYLHENGVVHRDVKPSNVLLGRRGEAYLSDFGVSRVLAEARAEDEGRLLVGTPSYVSPEQVGGAPASPASDVYALGLVLLQCLTGRREYADGGDALAIAMARLGRDPHVPADVQPGLAGLLRAMTARDPDARPGAAEVAGELAGQHAPPAAALGTGPAVAPLGTPAHAAAGGAPVPAVTGVGATPRPVPVPAPRAAPVAPAPAADVPRTGDEAPGPRRGRGRWVLAACGALVLAAGVVGWQGVPGPVGPPEGSTLDLVGEAAAAGPDAGTAAGTAGTGVPPLVNGTATTVTLGSLPTTAAAPAPRRTPRPGTRRPAGSPTATATSPGARVSPAPSTGARPGARPTAPATTAPAPRPTADATPSPSGTPGTRPGTTSAPATGEEPTATPTSGTSATVPPGPTPTVPPTPTGTPAPTPPEPTVTVPPEPEPTVTVPLPPTDLP